MLIEPQADAERLALDRAVAEAVRLRVAAGPRPSPDADAIALREILKDLPPAAPPLSARCWGGLTRQAARRWSSGAPPARPWPPTASA
jgi:hypothetical protein